MLPNPPPSRGCSFALSLRFAFPSSLIFSCAFSAFADDATARHVYFAVAYPLTPEIRQRIIDALATGQSYRKVAVECGCCHATVSRLALTFRQTGSIAPQEPPKPPQPKPQAPWQQMRRARALLDAFTAYYRDRHYRDPLAQAISLMRAHAGCTVPFPSMPVIHQIADEPSTCTNDDRRTNI